MSLIGRKPLKSQEKTYNILGSDVKFDKNIRICYNFIVLI